MIVNLQEHRHYVKKMSAIRELDIIASSVILEECLKNLNINKLPELNLIKDQIKVAIKKLEKANG